MRILVTGSRDWTDESLLRWAISSHLDGDDVIVHGDCPTGADAMAQEFADMTGLATERHKAQWSKYGRAAGPYRNQKMVDLGADVVLAFKNPGSRGTQDCINRATKARLPFKVFNPE